MQEISVQNPTDLNDRIPNGLWIVISRKFKNDVWDLWNLIDISNQVFAREKYYAIRKNAEDDVPKDYFFHWALITNSFWGKRKIIKTKFPTWKLRFIVTIKSIFLQDVMSSLM